jgi:predicted alpha/beta hydrolase family esterase
MKRFTRPVVLLTVLVGFSGCAGLREQVCQRPVEAMVIPAGTHGVVFAASGAGGWEGATKALKAAVAQQHVPLHVESVEWFHGRGLVLADQMDAENVQVEGRRLAGQVLAVQKQCPDLAIYLVGHSAGSAVILTAASCLPPSTVDRIVLLAPAVSAQYDLRAALRCARQGMDVFHSKRDWLWLGVGVAVVGTTDRCWSAAAGRVGFHVIAQTPEDAALFAKLRQHPWNPMVAWSGNAGGHYGSYKPDFLRAYVLPLFAESQQSLVVSR